MNFFRNPLTSNNRPRLALNAWDALALFIVFAIITLFGWNAAQMATPYHIGQSQAVSLDPRFLPFYAARTVVRMLIAMCISLLFTFIFGTWAAKSKRAGRFIIPIIDILQSVPILGYLSVVSVFFIGLFPGSLLGPECAAIFVIFTSQAWNMALGFYQTVRSVPPEVIEASRMFHLSTWQRFWRIDVPYSLPVLLWNMMASMSAGWFFVVASEAISVANQAILLPGIGSYIALAIDAADLRAISLAVLTMFIVIVIYDQLLFRPLIAWAEKFKPAQTVRDVERESWVIDLFRRTRLMRSIGYRFTILFDAFVNHALFRQKKQVMQKIRIQDDRPIRIIWYGLVLLSACTSLYYVLHFMLYQTSLHEVLLVLGLGIITGFRVFLLIVLCSMIWIPIGVWVGLKPRLAEIMQPVAQILSAFPANLFYPFIVLFIVHYELNPDIWLTPLMILGSQWYILFNVIAGASSIPKDLIQATDNFAVTGQLRWKRLLLPAIFPFYVTGAIAAAGGAWNASIVAEVVTWGHQRLVATGLGAYIADNTLQGNFQRVALGVGMMCLLVLIVNRLIWRPLYVYAENRFVLE